MAIPRNVQRQLEAAEALAAQPVQTHQPAVVVDDVTQLAATPAPQGEGQPSQPTAPAGQEFTQQPAAPSAPPTEDWQQKYRTLQGMFQAQVPQLQATVKRYESDMAAMRQQVDAMQRAQAARPAEPEKPVEPDPRDVRNFGEDMVEFVQRYTQQAYTTLNNAFSKAVGEMDQRVGRLEQTVTGVSQRTESTLESQFYAALAQMVPSWKDINAMPEWLEWLGQADPVYGIPRQAGLDNAFGKFDAGRVAAVFKQFIQSRPARPSDALNSQVSPSGGGGESSIPPQPQAKPTLTQRAVQLFYNDVARGKYRGKEAEQARLEAEINAAAVEGRIV